jgi:phosphate butyryltransferase
VSASTEQNAIKNFSELRRRAASVGPKRLAVVVADDDVALTAAADSLALEIALPVLIGSVQKIRVKAEALGPSVLLAKCECIDSDDPAGLATRLARSGEVDILLKGHLRTDELLKAVLDKQAGLRTGTLLSDVLFYVDVLAGKRLVGITDGGLNIAPTLDQKKQIVTNAIAVCRCLGMVRPKIAIMSATEVVTAALPSTQDAKALTEMGAVGEFGDALVFGPLALDNALLESAALAKGITHPVAGHADCMVVPNIESGNLLGKSVKYLSGSQCAHVAVGAKVPILIPSRVESVDDKVNSVALGVLYYAAR